MRIRQGLAVVALVVAGTTITVAQPAIADDTTATFTVAGGELGQAAPTTADLGSAAPGASNSAQLGAVTVTDLRAELNATWTETVSSTALTTGTATPTETIPTTAVSYWSGPVTATTGSGTFTPGQANSGAAVTLATARTAFSWAGTGNNSATFNPTLIVAVPASVIAGEYTATVTHSVA